MKKKKQTAKKLVAITLGACMLSVLVSCGSDDDDDGGTAPQQQQQEGEFRGTLKPVNPSLDNDLDGVVIITRQGDLFEAETDVNRAPGGVHIQKIHSGSSCPTIANDSNADGIIDISEANAVTGPVLIPLDSDLSSNMENGYPSGPSYAYSESTSFALLVADAESEDNVGTGTGADVGAGTGADVGAGTGADVGAGTGADVGAGTGADVGTPEAEIENEESDVIDDTLVILRDEPLESRVVMIYGVPATRPLPATVNTADGLTQQRTVPIACAVVERGEEVPAETVIGTDADTTETIGNEGQTTEI